MRILFANLILATVMLLQTMPAHAKERITDFRADIRIAADGSMTVDEHIRVMVEGHAIKHGITRDFPTDYRDRLRNRYQVGFEVLDASLDGQSEDWHTKRIDNGVRVYLGSKDRRVSSGQHDYRIRYRTTRQLGFFDQHDELYWNVTGTGWAFPIEHASAAIHLPVQVAAEKLKASGYTGSQGSDAQNLTTAILADGARYETTRALEPHQGLSVVLEFPKGIIAAPATQQKLIWLLQDNRNLLLALLGLALLWLYYGWTWNRVGRDPAAGPLVARYEPPDDDSAAALRYVSKMGYDNTCFTAGVLDLAARGKLTIEQDAEDVYSVTRTPGNDASKLSADNRKLLKKLFAASDRLEFKNTHHTVVSAARKAHQNALALQYEKKYFFTNSSKLWPGVLISLTTLGSMMIGAQPEAWFMLLWLSIWSMGVFVLVSAALGKSHGKGFKARFSGIGAWLFAIPFLIGEIFGLGIFGHMVGYAILPIFVALFATNFAFYHWMKAPTQDGAKLLDKINGFRWYLGVAEKQELDSRYKPESKPELFARYLPYAVALGVDNAWAERFANALTPMQMREAQPTWYHGSSIGSFSAHSFASFSSDLSSGMSSAIASSSVAPGSSSGGGGGGFSGGGGGGGGGGGW